MKLGLALIGGVEAEATVADIQTTAAIEQLLPLNPANRRIRTRMSGGVGGAEPRGSPLSRLCARAQRHRADGALRLLGGRNVNPQPPAYGAAP